MKNYNEVKDEVLGCTSLLFGVLATLVWSSNTNYIGLSEDEGWLLLAFEASICFVTITGFIFAIHWIAHKINKHATRQAIIKVLRKYNEITDKVFES